MIFWANYYKLYFQADMKYLDNISDISSEDVKDLWQLFQVKDSRISAFSL